MNNDFQNEFEKYIKNKRDEMYKNYNRVLPTNELLFDRWEKAKYINAGESSNIYDTSIVFGDVEIGNNVWVGPYTLLDGAKAKIKIGDWCTIGTGVLIFTHDSMKYYLTSGKEKFNVGSVEIGNNTQIGSMSMIACNVKIGHHSVIAANSFVNKNVPDYAIVAGNPAKIIGKVVIENDKVEFQYFNRKEESKC